MKVAVLGPLCKDEIIIQGKKSFCLGGAVYYAGHALSCLDTDVTVFATFGDEEKGWLEDFKYKKLVHIKSEGTIKFVNEYPDKENPGYRLQRAEIPKNEIRVPDLESMNLGDFDYLILAPLFHDNFPLETLRYLSGKRIKIFLIAQGMIRYLDDDKIVWRNPENIINAFPFIDYLLLDRYELEFLTKQENSIKDLRLLQSKGIDKIIVTNGSKGSVLFFGDKKYEIRAFPPKKLLDPTGAGDSYMAGFVKAQELFDNPQKQGEFAAMTATIAIESKGAFDKTLEGVYERLRRV